MLDDISNIFSLKGLELGKKSLNFENIGWNEQCIVRKKYFWFYKYIVLPTLWNSSPRIFGVYNTKYHIWIYNVCK